MKQTYRRINTQVATIYLRIFLIIFEGSYMLPSETTAKLNFMLLILWLFLMFIPFISQCYVFEIHPFVHTCNLVHLLHCCIVIHCRNIPEFNDLSYLCMFSLSPVFFAIMNNATRNGPVYVSLYVRVSLDSTI